MAKILALAMQQDSKSSNITLPGNMNFSHLSTIQRCFREGATFASSDEQSETSEGLSGLQVQPTIKSKISLLYTAVDTRNLHGILVLKHGDTVRYLGYAVGTEELATVNWAARMRNV